MVFLESALAWVILMDCLVASHEASHGPVSLKHQPWAKGQTASASRLEDIHCHCSLESILRGKGESSACFLLSETQACNLYTDSKCQQKAHSWNLPAASRADLWQKLHLLYIKAFACSQLSDHQLLMRYDKDGWVLNLLALLQDHF